ncbi:MAG TPA: hypothetical protein VK470_05580 [Bacteroidota bacterium]|nr:hypothetical protein [Bacteroidota bacterium]
MIRVVVCALFIVSTVSAQVKPAITVIGGDDVPAIKEKITATLEVVLLEMNRVKSGTGSVSALSSVFQTEAHAVFAKYVEQNKPVTARKRYEVQMIERQKGQCYDIRSIMVKVDVGETEASTVQNLVFTFSRDCRITSIRSVLPSYDYHTIIARGETPEDSLMRGCILDFMEQFRMAYNAKNLPFLEKVYSDDALILVGSVLQEKPETDDMMHHTYLAPAKVKLIQQTKREYIDGLRERAFAYNAFINVRFDDLTIVRHEKIPWLYGVSCFQQWNSSQYSDKGFLFLMMDFRNASEPVIHVRTWQPKAFDNGQYVSLDDFEVVAPKQ